MYTKHAEYGHWKCKVCNFIVKTRRELRLHYKLHSNKEKMGWSRGFTKYTHPSLLKISNSLLHGLKTGTIIPAFKGKHHTKETKDRIISTYIQNRTNNKYRGTYKGIYFQYSFELAWIVWNLEHDIKVFRCEESFQYWDGELQKERTYYPDFVLEDGTIVEIKGRVISSTLDKLRAMIDIYHRKYLLLTRNKILYCLDYCKEKYGNDFVLKLKNT